MQNISSVSEIARSASQLELVEEAKEGLEGMTCAKSVARGYKVNAGTISSRSSLGPRITASSHTS